MLIFSFKLGYIYEISGNLRKALDYYDKSANINKKNAEVFYNSGNIYFSLGLKSKAKDSYKLAIKINKEHVGALYNLSVIAYTDKDPENAIKYCDKGCFSRIQDTRRICGSVERI